MRREQCCQLNHKRLKKTDIPLTEINQNFFLHKSAYKLTVSNRVGNTDEEDFEDESLKRFEVKDVDPHSVRVMDQYMETSLVCQF